MRSSLFRKKVGIVLGISFIVLAVIVPISQTSAQTDTITNAGMMPWRVGSMIMKNLAGQGLIFTVGAVDWVLRLRIVTSTTVISRTWTIVRDLANMFFIVFLIIMAFATIFDLGGSFGYAGYDVGSLLTRFLIAALLINFSLIIGQQLIEWTQILNGAFLNSIGEIAKTMLETMDLKGLLGVSAPTAPSAVNQAVTALCSNSLAQFITPGAAIGCTVQKFGGLINNIANSAVFQGAAALIATTTEDPAKYAQTIFQNVITTIFFVILIFSFLVPILFGIIRIPFLWFLLILSPLAWLCSILPSTRHISQAWWKQFWGWNLFLPIYLFFLMIGMSILKQQDAVMSDLMNAWANNTSGTPPLVGAAMTSLEVLFFYVFTGIVFIGGAGMAFKSSFVAGTAAAGAASWSKSAIGATGGAFSRFTGASAVGQAAKQRVDQFQKEGFQNRYLNRVYGGQAGQDALTGKAGQLFGVRGADVASQKPFMDKFGKEYGELQNQYATGTVKAEDIKRIALTGNANDARILAYRKKAVEMGMLTPDMLTKTASELSSSPLALNDFFESAKKGKFSELSPQQQLAAASASVYVDKDTKAVSDFTSLGSSVAATEGRRDLFLSIADNKKAVKEMTEEQYVKAIDLFGGATTANAREFMKKVNTQRPDLAASPKVQAKLPAHDQKPASDVYKSIIADASAETIANIKLNVWQDTSGNVDKDFESILTKRLMNREESRRKEFYAKLREEVDGNSTDKEPDKDRKLAILEEIYQKVDSAGANENSFDSIFSKILDRESRARRP